MSKTITVNDAIEQGYMFFAHDTGEFGHLHKIENITDADFEPDRPLYVAEKESYYSPSISSEEIAEALADIIDCQCGDETGDDTDDVRDIVIELDFTEVAEKINEALKHKKYYKLTTIQLIPNPATNEQ